MRLANNGLKIKLAGLFFCALTAVIYWPGLHGGFLFDDFGSLPSLGAFGPVTHWDVFWRYITSGIADPTGRPLAMLSFLIDAHNWPAAPFSFKLTNLILHIANGILLMLLLKQLGRVALTHASATRIELAAVLGGTLWMLHPMWVSTTLYIVQRETMLAASFVLLGLQAWLHGRSALQNGRHCRGTFWIAVGLGICTALAVCSKANGILLPILALTVEYAFLRQYVPMPSGQSGILYQRMMLWLAWLPTALITAYLIHEGWNGLVHGISSVRPWTLEERLLTEPRMLMRYLDLLWLPKPFSPGLFNDQIRASHSLWHPTTTLLSILGVLALLLTAGWSRRRWPPLTLAIAFYFAGHLMESTTIPLELYFEHRNYLPATLLFWPLALWLCQIPMRTPSSLTAQPPSAKPSQTLTISLAICLLLSLALMTHARASLWGNTRDQLLFWAALNPRSARAQANAAHVEMETGHPLQAARRLQKALADAPNEVQLALNLFDAQCQSGHVDPATLSNVQIALRTTRDPGPLLLNWFDAKLSQYQHPACAQLSISTLDNLLHQALANPQLMSVYGRRQDLYHLKGRLALAQGRSEDALVDFDLALDQQVDAQTALKQAALLGAAGFPRQGLAHLDYFEARQANSPKAAFGTPRVHAWVLQRQHYWTQEVTRLRATLSSDASTQADRSDEAAANFPKTK